MTKTNFKKALNSDGKYFLWISAVYQNLGVNLYNFLNGFKYVFPSKNKFGCVGMHLHKDLTDVRIVDGLY